MAGTAQFRTEHIAETPRGYHVRQFSPGPRSEHLVRVAFPPGRRKKGSGKLVEILHPASERNPKCDLSEKARKNPGELLIFGNPSTPRVETYKLSSGSGRHIRKATKVIFPDGREVKFTERLGKRAAITQAKAQLGMNPSKHEQQRAARDRASRIRGARLNPRGHKAGCKCFACKHARGENPARGKKHDVYGRKFRGATEQEAKKRALRLHELKGRRAAKRTFGRTNPARRKRTNPNDTQQAVRLFETFHGKKANEIVEKHVSAAMRKDYTALGSLDYLKIRTPLGQLVEFSFESDGVKLASSPDGRQLYAIGGNQNVERCVDDDSLQKDLIDLGDGVEVAYTARKIHTGYTPTQWFHKFGEKTGSLPRIGYDKLRKQIFFIGGDYYIDTKAAVSPGIEN